MLINDLDVFDRKRETEKIVDLKVIGITNCWPKK